MNQLRYVCISFNGAPPEGEPFWSLQNMKKEFSSSNSVFNQKKPHYQHYLYYYAPTPPTSCLVCGIDVSPGNFHIINRDTEEMFFIFVIRGKGTLNGNSFHAGQFFILPSHHLTTMISDREDPWTICWLSYRGNIPDKFYRTFAQYDAAEFYSFEKPEALLQLYTGFLYCDHSHADSKVLCDAFCTCVLSIFDNSDATFGVSKDTAASQRIRSYVKKAKDLLSKQYATINISNLSEQLHLNRKYLCKIFHSMTGTTPQDYLIDIRLQNSVYFLIETDHSPENISTMCGYCSYTGFLQAFKKKYGITPQEYRKQMKC